MTKKHFQLIAAVVQNIRDNDDRVNAAIAFANAFREENPRFDSERFFAACGVDAIV